MPLATNEKKALDLLRKVLEEEYGLIDLRIFGSKAKGHDTAESDIDVMIVLERSNPQIESEIDDLVFELNIQFDCLIVPLYFAHEELISGPLDESPVYKKALAEGIAWRS